MQYQLSDETIGHIARLLQLAILTGTDVVDNLRAVRVTPNDKDPSVLDPTKDYYETFEDNLERMQDHLNEKTAEQ